MTGDSHHGIVGFIVMMRVAIKDLKEVRKQMFDDMEQKLREKYPKEEDGMFYYHSSEDRIVLLHA